MAISAAAGAGSTVAISEISGRKRSRREFEEAKAGAGDGAAEKTVSVIASRAAMPAASRARTEKYDDPTKEDRLCALSTSVGAVEHLRYFFPYKSVKNYLDRETKSELSKYTDAHITCSPLMGRAYRGFLGVAGDIDAGTKGLRTCLSHIGDYTEIMSYTPAIPTFLDLKKIPGMADNYGVFARHDIAGNTFLGSFTGKLVPRISVRDFTYAFNLGDSHCVDATASGNYLRFVNHSERHPNIVIKLLKYTNDKGEPQLLLAFFSDGPISKGEQLLYPYGPAYDWSHVPGGKPFEITPRTFMLDTEKGVIVESLRRTTKPKILFDCG